MVMLMTYSHVNIARKSMKRIKNSKKSKKQAESVRCQTLNSNEIETVLK